jgi:probable rRNA maturation factor
VSGRLVRVSNRHSRLRLERGAVAEVIRALDAGAGRLGGGCPAGELAVAFLSDAALARLHGRFLNDPSPTDVITFEGARDHGLAGEICVSVDAAVRAGGRAPSRFSRELTLYIVHGWLHLAGHDDLNPAAKRAMRRSEARAMRILGLRRAIPRFKLASATRRT